MNKSEKLRQLTVIAHGERQMIVSYERFRPQGYYIWVLDSDYRVERKIFLGASFKEAAETIQKKDLFDEKR